MPTFVYVGTYTGSKSKGIYLFRLQTENLEVSQNITLVPLGLAAETSNPSFIELDLKRRLLFAVNELNEFEGKPTGAVSAFSIDRDTGMLTPLNQRPSMCAGPRHMVFRPDGRFAFVVNELSSTITVFAYDSGAGVLRERQTVSTLPEYFDGANTTAEIDVHPSGKWLYVSNRGHNSVVLFNVDADKGTLTYVEEQGTGGFKPRHFGIEPSAKHLAIANQDSDTVLVARIDAGNGRLKPSGVFAQAPTPVCVKFLPPP